MAEEKKDDYRTAAHRQNLIASLNYAKRLTEQIPKGVAAHGRELVELGVLAQILVTRDLEIINGESFPVRDFAVLVESFCARLGYRITRADFALKHYDIELKSKDRDPFRTIVSCPDNIAIDLYMPFVCSERGDQYESHRIIRELTDGEVAMEIKIRSSERKRKFPNDSVTAAIESRPSLGATVEEIEVVKAVQQSGILDVYKDVLSRRNEELKQGLPLDVGHNFLSFLRTAVKMKLPQAILSHFFKEFGGRIELYKAQGIAMVLSNGEVKMFLPTVSLNPTLGLLRSPLQLNGLSMTRRGGQPEPLTALMHRRAGYVPAGAKIFLQALLHSAGSFGREMDPVSIRKRD